MIQENARFHPLVLSSYFSHIVSKNKNIWIFLHQNPTMSMTKTVMWLQDSICRI